MGDEPAELERLIAPSAAMYLRRRQSRAYLVPIVGWPLLVIGLNFVMYILTRGGNPVLEGTIVVFIMVQIPIGLLLIPKPPRVSSDRPAPTPLWFFGPPARWTCGLQQHEIEAAGSARELRWFMAESLRTRRWSVGLLQILLTVYGVLPLALLIALSLPTSSAALYVPVFVVAVVSGTAVFYRLILSRVVSPELRARLREAGCNTCVRCGYDLSGHGEANVTCPECGLRHPEPPGEVIRDSPWFAEMDESTNNSDDSSRSHLRRG